MGWEGIHLYYFDIYAVHHGAFELDAESPDLPFSVFQFRERDRFSYVYDMGDYWEHEVRIEKFLEPHAKKTHAICTGGSGVCPPGDCGDPPGYPECQGEAMCLDAWSDMDRIVDFSRRFPGGSKRREPGRRRTGGPGGRP